MIAGVMISICNFTSIKTEAASQQLLKEGHYEDCDLDGEDECVQPGNSCYYSNSNT